MNPAPVGQPLSQRLMGLAVGAALTLGIAYTIKSAFDLARPQTAIHAPAAAAGPA